MLTPFLKRDEGNVAMIFTLALVPIMGLFGSAVDYSRGAQAQSRLRAAVDAAALAAAAASDDTRSVVGQNYLANNLQNAGLTGVTSTFVKNADGTVTATASGSVPTYIAGVFGVSSIGVKASATANNVAQPPKEISFTAISAQGWYWKQIDLIVLNANETTEKTLASYVYQPNDRSGNGVGGLTAKYNDGLGNMSVGDLSKKLTLQTNYQNLYLKMTAYEDGCGPGMLPAPDSTSSKFKCAKEKSNYTYDINTTTTTCTGYGRNTVCTTKTTTTTNTVITGSKSSKVWYYSTNPKDSASQASSHNLFVQDFLKSPVTNGLTADGRWVRDVSISGTSTRMAMMPNNVTPSIFDILPCPTPVGGLIQQWEDTYWDGNSKDFPGNDAWKDQDFTFKIDTSAANSCAPNANYNNVTTTTANGQKTSSQRSVFITK